jgi:transcriptional regulator with XRE-family HTH domain
MIDYRQIRAARALLNWSQADLARAAGMATSSIKNIENETATSRRETMIQVRDAFDQNGVEFLAGSGVRLKTDIVAVHDGKRATSALLESILLHAQKSPDREVCIIGLDETFSVETDGLLPIVEHIDRLAKMGIRERILVCEGDTRFLNAPDCYRWLPQQYFSRNAPIYIYGDMVAIHSGSLRRRTVTIESRPLARHLKMLFALLWDHAQIATTLVSASPSRRRATG